MKEKKKKNEKSISRRPSWQINIFDARRKIVEMK